MPGYLRQSTAAQSRALGPFVDETDFKTAETGLTIANTDIKLVANGAASANKNSGGGTHRVNGVYGITFDATDTATVGELRVSVVVAGALAVFDTFTVVEEAVYDALFVAAAPGYVLNQPVNATQLAGQTITAAAGVTFPTSVASPTNITAGVITTTTNLTNAPPDSSGVTTLLSRLSALRAGYLDNLSAGAAALEASVQALITTVGASAAGIATAVWGAATRVLTAGTNIALAKGTGVTGFTDIDAAGVRTAVGLATANLDTQLAAIDDFLDTEIAAIKAKTDNLPSDPADASDVAGAFSTVNTTLATIAGYLDTEIAAILADTNELQTDWVNGGRLDLLVDAIKTQTDLLPGSPAATGAAMTLTAGERSSVAAALLDLAAGVETGLTVRQALRLIAAAEAGKLSGAATTTVVIRDVADSKDRITATVDADGNRSAITTDLT